MKLRIENEHNRLLAIEENRSKNKRAFDVAMKAGENAMKKKKWQEALAHFDEALTLIPDEEEAITERDKARAKLDALAEDNDVQEAARAAEEAAAAEALAKENAEKLADEEDARRRQEEADARRATAAAASANEVNTDPVPDPVPDPISDPVEDDDPVEDTDAANAADAAAAEAAADSRDKEAASRALEEQVRRESEDAKRRDRLEAVSYTHLRAHET